MGIAEGALGASRNKLVRLLEMRFGVVPQGVRGRIAAMVSMAELDTLFDKTVVAASLGEWELVAA